MTEKPICDIWFEQLTEAQQNEVMGYPINRTAIDYWTSIGKPEKWTIYNRFSKKFEATPLDVPIPAPEPEQVLDEPEEETPAPEPEQAEVVDTGEGSTGATLTITATVTDDIVTCDIDPLAIWSSEDDTEAEETTDADEYEIQPDEVQEIDYSALSFRDLQKECKANGINPWGKKKTALIKLLTEL